LRAAVIVLGGIVLTAGTLLVRSGTRGSGIYLVCVGLAIVLGTAFERWRYRSSSAPGAHWERTGERFEDPTTGETMDVQYDPTTGERRYIRAVDSAQRKLT
jgi:hypothetical protein